MKKLLSLLTIYRNNSNACIWADVWRGGKHNEFVLYNGAHDDDQKKSIQDVEEEKLQKDLEAAINDGIGLRQTIFRKLHILQMLMKQCNRRTEIGIIADFEAGRMR